LSNWNRLFARFRKRRIAQGDAPDLVKIEQGAAAFQ